MSMIEIFPLVKSAPESPVIDITDFPPKNRVFAVIVTCSVLRAHGFTVVCPILFVQNIAGITVKGVAYPNDPVPVEVHDMQHGKP